MKEIAKEIRKRIKNELGYNQRQVSVRSDYNSIRVFIKDVEAVTDIGKIDDIATSYENIRRDEYSGEILCCGNTFVFVEIESKLFRNIADGLKKAFNDFQIDNCFNIEGENGRYTIAKEVDGWGVYNSKGYCRSCWDFEQAIGYFAYMLINCKEKSLLKNHYNYI